MNKITLWIIVLLIGILFAVFVLIKLLSSSTSISPSPTPTGNFPTSNPVAAPTPTSPSPVPVSNIPPPINNTSATIRLIARNGSSVVTKDFIHNGETVADIENPGDYFLAGSVGYCLANGTCPSGASTTDFQLTYNAPKQYFNIILLKEPLSNTRRVAEQFLLNRLGISSTDLCSLNYYLGTPTWISEIYTSKNLGFSFCPGAVQLP